MQPFCLAQTTVLMASLLAVVLISNALMGPVYARRHLGDE